MCVVGDSGGFCCAKKSFVLRKSVKGPYKMKSHTQRDVGYRTLNVLSSESVGGSEA